MRTSVLLAAAVLAASGTANAAERSPRPDPWDDATVSRADAEAKSAQQFDTLDANHDGVLSDDELAAMRPAGAGRDRPMGGGMGGGMMSRMLDADGDGKITRAEFIAAGQRRFDMADANHDGQLTKAERDSAREAMRARFRERMRNDGMPGGAMTGGANMGDEGPPPADDGNN